MPDLVQWARTAQRTGLAVLRGQKGEEIRVAFSKGRIVFTSTNNRRENYSRYLVFRGYCTQADIDDALAIQKKTGMMMASVLIRKERLSERDAVATLTEKTFEDLCSVFLWKDGEFEFDPTHGAPARFLPIDVDPIEVVLEGVRRSDMWSRMGASLHPRSWFEETDVPFPRRDSEWEDESLALLVRPLMTGDRSIEEVLEKLPFSRYKVYRAVFELLERRLIRHGEATAAVDREQRIRTKLAEAEDAVAASRYSEAMEILQGLSSTNPGRREIAERLLQIADRFRAAIFVENFSLSDVPVVTVGLESLSHLRLDPTDGFLLSRIDGRLTIQEILRIVPVREFEALRSIKRLLNAKVLDFPNRRAPLGGVDVEKKEVKGRT